MPIKQKKFWQIQLLLWTAFALLTKFTWLNTYPPSWWWVVNYMGLGCAFSSMLAIIYTFIEHKPVKHIVILSALLSIVFALLWRLCFNAMEYHVLESANNQFKFWGYFHNGKSAVMHLLIWSAGYWLLTMQSRLNRAHQEKQQLALDAKEAQLKMLQYQIAPHFLFNVMSSIDTMLLKNDNKSARTMLSKLSKYLRQTLYNEQQSSLELEQELALCQNYLDIERMRFQEKLSVNWNVPDKIPHCQLPNGILIPLLENALKHGTAITNKHAVIDVSLVEHKGQLTFIVQNPIAEIIEKKEGFGLGLKNTRDRLKRFYGDKATFITQQDNNLFKAKLTIAL